MRQRPRLVDFHLDLTAHELTRLAAVGRALGPDFDEIGALEAEQQAEDLLYANLDAEQAAVHEMLVREGVLPPREVRTDVA